MARNSNGFLSTDTELIGFGSGKEYSGASGIYVDNENNVISITGEVGKEYNGIEPIVVNNEENLISANSAPIGVQEPLYFVQDDDEAVIIGLSGEYVSPSDIAGKMDTSAFESWQQGQYTNDLTAINEKINEVSSNIPSLEGYATEQWVEDKGYLTAVSIPESATWEDTSEVVKTSSGTWNTVTDKLDVTAQVISSCETSSVDDKTLVTKLNGNEIAVGYAGSAHVADIALKDYQGNSFIPFYAKTSALEEKLDTTAFSTVSGDFLTAHQSLSDYYTKDETSGKEELANAFANIPAGDTEVNAYVHNNSASLSDTSDLVQNNSSTWNDITAYQSNSSTYITAHQSLDGYATETLVEETSGAITSLIPTDYYPDTNPSGFISGVDLTPYQTIEGMTAYQPVGSYATTNELEQVSADITATIPSTAGLASESYVQTNSAVLTGMIDGKQDTLTFGYDEQDRINSINSSALAGGGDVPEDVMVESAIGYNAVNEISAYNGSAIAQYGAEKQWLVHDDTIVHIANSAQYAFGCNISALQRLMGIDETVLYSNTAVSNTIVLNEACTNFERLRLKIYSPQSTGFVSYHEIEPKTNELWFARQCMIPASQYKLQIVCEYFTANNAQNYTFVSGCRWYGNNNVAGGDTTTNLTGASLKDGGYITEIVGIGRKQ